VSDTTTQRSRRAERAANLFDLRRIIGGLFSIWGILLIILGLTDSHAEKTRAAGININLYAGLGILIVGIIFLIWALTRPLGEQLREAEESERTGPHNAPAPHGIDAAALASEESRRRVRGDRQGPGGSGDPGSQ
jgi:hypothetical protein